VRKASISSKVAQKSLHSIVNQDPTMDQDHTMSPSSHRVDDLFLFGGGNADGDGIVAELREKDRKRRLSVEEQQLLRTKQQARKLDHEKKKQEGEMKRKEKERVKQEIIDAEVSPSAYDKLRTNPFIPHYL
jgi:ABC-type uncharacterized transport system ATPase subunit